MKHALARAMRQVRPGTACAYLALTVAFALGCGNAEDSKSSGGDASAAASTTDTGTSNSGIGTSTGDTPSSSTSVGGGTTTTSTEGGSDGGNTSGADVTSSTTVAGSWGSGAGGSSASGGWGGSGGATGGTGGSGGTGNDAACPETAPQASDVCSTEELQCSYAALCFNDDFVCRNAAWVELPDTSIEDPECDSTLLDCDELSDFLALLRFSLMECDGAEDCQTTTVDECGCVVPVGNPQLLERFDAAVADEQRCDACDRSCPTTPPPNWECQGLPNTLPPLIQCTATN